MTEREQRIKALDEVVKTLEKFDDKERRAKEEAEGKKVMYDSGMSGYSSVSAAYMYTTSSGQLQQHSHAVNYHPYQAAGTQAIPQNLSNEHLMGLVDDDDRGVATTAGAFSSFIAKIKLWK